MSDSAGTTYDVVVLAEQELSTVDATQVIALHEGIDDPVRYHLLMPVENAAARIEGGIGALGAGEVLSSPAMVLDTHDLEELQENLVEDCRGQVERGVALLTQAGADASGTPVSIDPIEALAGTVAKVDAREAIILTRSHVVAEFFHVDWTSRARRKLGVPVLHLIEHENFDEQAGQGEGVTGL